LRDQVRDEILGDPRYLTYQALERSIRDIRAALDGAAALQLELEPVVAHPHLTASANGREEPQGGPAQVDSEAMANLQHALIDLINRDHGANGAAPAGRGTAGVVGQTAAVARDEPRASTATSSGQPGS